MKIAILAVLMVGCGIEIEKIEVPVNVVVEGETVDSGSTEVSDPTPKADKLVKKPKKPKKVKIEKVDDDSGVVEELSAENDVETPAEEAEEIDEEQPVVVIEAPEVIEPVGCEGVRRVRLGSTGAEEIRMPYYCDYHEWIDLYFTENQVVAPYHNGGDWMIEVYKHPLSAADNESCRPLFESLKQFDLVKGVENCPDSGQCVITNVDETLSCLVNHM